MANVVYAYARVSSEEQNLDRQIAALKTYGVAERNIITDKMTGKNTERPGLTLLLDQLLRQGDTLVVKELDRLSRSYKDIKEIYRKLKDMGVDIVVIDTPLLSTQNHSDIEREFVANVIFELYSYLAEKERLRIHKRQAEGIAAARKAGKHLGRPQILLPSNWDIETRKWLAKEQTAVETMHHLGLSRSVFYKFANEQGLRIQIVDLDKGNKP